MEAYNNNIDETQDSRFFNIYSRTRSWVSATLGIVVTIIGIAVIFTIASLQGTKEISASNGDGAKMLQMWREAYPGMEFPQEKADIITYKDKEYYFIIDKVSEDGEILKWHFAYDGGIDFVYKDFKYWALTLLVYMVTMFVSQINYKSASRSAKKTKDFQDTLKYYQSKKQLIEPYTQYTPNFCIYKNKQMYETAKRDIVESAGITYTRYTSEKFNKNELEDWQKKKLKEIRKIKIKKIRSADLLQEQGSSSTKITLLPMSEKEHQRMFVISGGIQKIVTSALSGLVVAFGVVLGNWWLGICYGFAVLLGAISSVIVATDYVINTLRNRYIAKADLLNEFYNIKQKFIDEDVKNQDISIQN